MSQTMKRVKIDIFLILTGVLLCTICFFSSCQVDNQEGYKVRDFMAYYYPVNELQEGRIYEYRPVNNDSLPVDYWYYSTHKVDDELHFTGNYYDSRFEVQQFIREIEKENAMFLADFILYETDTLGKQKPITVEILERNTFPIHFADSTKTFKMGVKWDISGAEVATSLALKRERKYIAMSEYTYKGERLDCAIFKTLENIEHFVIDDGYLEPSFPGVEIYAKGLGLVYYKKQLSTDINIEYELYTTYTIEEFENKYKRSIK